MDTSVSRITHQMGSSSAQHTHVFVHDKLCNTLGQGFQTEENILLCSGRPNRGVEKKMSAKKTHTMVDCKYSTVEIHEWAPRAWPSAGSVPNWKHSVTGNDSLTAEVIISSQMSKRRQVVNNSSG